MFYRFLWNDQSPGSFGCRFSATYPGKQSRGGNRSRIDRTMAESSEKMSPVTIQGHCPLGPAYYQTNPIPCGFLTGSETGNYRRIGGNAQAALPVTTRVMKCSAVACEAPGKLPTGGTAQVFRSERHPGNGNHIRWGGLGIYDYPVNTWLSPVGPY